MKKPVLYLMIGFPASGKSSFLEKQKELAVFSADAVRGEWFGDEGLQYTDDFLKSAGIDPERLSRDEKCEKASMLVFEEVYRRTEEAIRNGTNAAIDGTSLTKWSRGMMISRFRDIASIRGIWIKTDPELCIRRDAERSRSVGEQRILEFVSMFVPPVLEEGFDALEVRDENGCLLSRTENRGNTCGN